MAKDNSVSCIHEKRWPHFLPKDHQEKNNVFDYFVLFGYSLILETFWTLLNPGKVHEDPFRCRPSKDMGDSFFSPGVDLYVIREQRRRNRCNDGPKPRNIEKLPWERSKAQEH